MHFSRQQDGFWSDWFGGSWAVGTDDGNARRAYAHTVLMALRTFQKCGPERYLENQTTRRTIERRVSEARLPFLDAWGLQEIATSHPYPPIDSDSDTE